MKWLTCLGCLGMSLVTHSVILSFFLALIALVFVVGLFWEGINKLKEIL